MATLITTRQVNYIEQLKETREWEGDPVLAERIRAVAPDSTTFQEGATILWDMAHLPLRMPKK